MSLKKNDIRELTVTGFTADGYGVGRIDGMVIFLPFSAIGDRLKVRILKVKKNLAYAKIEEIITPSPDRITPDCPLFTKCGGCSLRHISYEAELKIKENTVRDAFTNIGKIDAPMLPIIPNENITGYRNKLQMPMGISKDGDIVAGFYAFHTHRIVPCDNCLLQPEIFSLIVNEVKKEAKALDIEVYNEENHTGILRHIYLRKGHYSGEIMLCIVAARNDKRIAQLINKVCEKFPEIKTGLININSQKTNVILGQQEIYVKGDGKIYDIMCKNKVEISPKAFYQVNTPQAERLYNTALALADAKDKRVLDLYCGAGTITLAAARQAKEAIGVEKIPQAIENAKRNAELNGITNVRFICSDSAEAAKQLHKENKKIDIVIVDPPRKGCSPDAIKEIVRFNPEKIVMISCNPSTAARDCALLKEQGYITNSYTPVDLFSRTGHVECVVMLSKVQN